MRNVRGAGFLVASMMVFGAQVRAQNTSTGMTQPPGTQTSGSATPCATLDASGLPSNQAQVDANCAAMGPNFAMPSTNTPTTPERPLTAVIRLDSVVEKPAALPFPADFHVVGSATMIKARVPRLRACFGMAKGWSTRANTTSSVTCIDYKGEVVAYQECKPASGGTPMVCTNVMPGDKSASVATAARP